MINLLSVARPPQPLDFRSLLHSKTVSSRRATIFISKIPNYTLTELRVGHTSIVSKHLDVQLLLRHQTGSLWHYCSIERRNDVQWPLSYDTTLATLPMDSLCLKFHWPQLETSSHNRIWITIYPSNIGLYTNKSK